MITIKKDNDTKIVTQGAYREYYECLGYEIVKNEKPLKKEVEKIKEVDKKTDKGKLDGYSRK